MDNEASQAGNLFSPSLEAEESSLSWTREPNTGLLGMGPTSPSKVFSNDVSQSRLTPFVQDPRRRASTKPAFKACDRVQGDQHRLTLFMQDPQSPGKYQAILHL